MILPDRYIVRGFEHESLRADVRKITSRPPLTNMYDVSQRRVAADSIAPFTITAVDGSAEVTIYPGDVSDGFTGGIVPKIGATFLNAAPAPELTVITGSVYLHATIDDDGEFTNLLVENAATLPADTSTERYRQIGTISVSGSVVTVTMQSVRDSQAHALCNGASNWGQA